MKEICMSDNKIAIVDDDDYERIIKYNWHCSPNGYAGTSMLTDNGRRIIWMHRMIMNAPKGKVVDHINHNKLDNRRSNLRLCNQSQNMANCKVQYKSKSGYKGIIWDKRCNKWRVTVVYHYKKIHLGLYDDIELAKIVYRSYAKRLFGEFAK